MKSPCPDKQSFSPVRMRRGAHLQALNATDTTTVNVVTGSRAVPRTDRSKRKVGHEGEFVERPPKQFQRECSICLLILREPHLISCCGHSFCEDCIGRIREDGKPCPLCNEPTFVTLPNQGLQRSLNEFDVSCSHRELGCEWVGKLGSLDGHLNAEPQPGCQLVGCQFVELECNHCKTYVRRLAIAVHHNERCPKRAYTCEYCKEYKSTFEDVASQHYSECRHFILPCPNNCSPEGSMIERQDLEHHVQEDCPLTIVDCSLHYAGCEVRLPRKDLSSHMREDASSHVTLLAAENQRMTKQLLEKDRRIQENVQHLTEGSTDLRSCIDELKQELAKHQQLNIAGKGGTLQQEHQQSRGKELTKQQQVTAVQVEKIQQELRREHADQKQHTIQQLVTDPKNRELGTLLGQRLRKGDTWFLVDMRWMKQWKRYVGYDQWDQSSAGLDSAHPGPVDNSGLFKNIHAGTLKDHLMEGHDYSLLPEAAWAKVLSWYGITEGSRPIARKVVKSGLYMKHCKVEVYLLEFKLYMHPNLTDVSAATISRVATVDDLEQEFRLKFNIPKHSVCRVWHRDRTHTYELLSQGQQTLQDAGLYNGQTIVLEQRNANGTWPRTAMK